MKNKQKAYGWALLSVFTAIFLFGFLAPEAAPHSAQKTQFVILEDNGTDYKSDLLRSSEAQQEGTKQHNDFLVSYVQVYHSASACVRTAQIAELENAERPTASLYISHSCFLI